MKVYNLYELNDLSFSNIISPILESYQLDIFPTGIVKPFESFTITFDSEYENFICLLLQSSLNELNQKTVIVFHPSDFDDKFFLPLQTMDYFCNLNNLNFAVLNDDESKDFWDNVDYVNNELNTLLKDSKQKSKALNKLLAYPLDVFEEVGLSQSELEIKYDRKKGNHCKPYNLILHLLSHYNTADLFKITGKKYQSIFRNCQMVGNRLIELKYQPNREKILIRLEGKIYSIQFGTKDTSTMAQLGSRGLDNMVEIISNKSLGKSELAKNEVIVKYCNQNGINPQELIDNPSMLAKVNSEEVRTLINSHKTIGKIDLSNHPLVIKYCEEKGINPQYIKSNMSVLANADSEEVRTLFEMYAAKDVFLTQYLYGSLTNYFNDVRSRLGLEKVPEMKNTTGSNVAKILLDLYFKHFGDEKLVRKLLPLNHSEHLSEQSIFNLFGIQGLLTTGGLLFTRLAKHPFLDGTKLLDSDIVGAYATACQYTNIYLGEPLIQSYKNKKYTLRKYVNLLNKICDTDGWYLRVSGKLSKAINTLIYSDLSFIPKRKSFKDATESKLGLWNKGKNSKELCNNKLLLKEIKFGVITHGVIAALQQLPEEWYNEFLDNLYVDFALYHPKFLVVDNIEDYYNLVHKLPDDNLVEKFTLLDLDEEELDAQLESGNFELGVNFQQSISKNNLTLKFPLPQYVSELKVMRQNFKDKEDPRQELVKLVINTMYGALACLFLATNNPLASNQITSLVRSQCWMKINGNNGFQAITDGCTGNLNNIPYGMKFKKVLELYPSYLTEFEPTISNTFLDDVTELKELNGKLKNDLPNNLKQHYYDFYECESNFILDKFGSELKDCKEFKSTHSVIGEKCYLYHRFPNHGSGNYCKIFNNEYAMYDDYEAQFIEIDEYSKLKSRGFISNNTDAEWYLETMKGKYEPRLFIQNHIIKFSEGIEKVIQGFKHYFDEGIINLVFPTGTSIYECKLMKLITPSQFVFQNEKQLGNFQRQCLKVSQLSKNIDSRLFSSLITSIEFEELVKSYPQYFERRNIIVNSEEVYKFMCEHPIGYGLELLTYLPSHDGSLKSVRTLIADSVTRGCLDFNAKLNLDRNLKIILHKQPQLYRYLILCCLIKANEVKYLLSECAKRVDQPTLMTQNIFNLKEFNSPFNREMYL